MSLFDAEARAFISRPIIGRLATVTADGSPTVVPLWYKLEGDDILITSERKTGKVANLLRDPRAALNVGGEPDDGPAYLIRGRVTLTDDADHVWLRKLTEHYEAPEEAEKDLAEWASMDIVLIRMTVERVTKVY